MRLTSDYINYKKKKFAAGGQMSVDYGAIASGVNTAVDTIDQGNSLGRKSTGSYALKGAASGAAMGSVAGPWGTAVGAVVGAGVGLVAGGAAKRKERRYLAAEKQRYDQSQQQQSMAVLGANPELMTGYNPGSEGGYYANGGQLRGMGKGTLDVVGPSHENGGVQIGPNEVEGGETIDKGYVFSKKLGFAQEHRPLAKAMARIEEKPFSMYTKNAMDRMQTRVEKMKLAQEYVKQLKNI